MKKLYVVGIGPGDAAQRTPQAEAAIAESALLCGYGLYLQAVRGQYPDKQYYSTPMRQEVERCRYALRSAAQGITTALLCGGDAGVYGLAGPVLALSEQYPEVEVVLVPGITAALSGAALVGAPLMNDFMVLSLSDLLTPWEVIERRLRAAAAGDLVLCLYNPGSQRRRGHLRWAVSLLIQAGKAPETVCAVVRNIARADTSTALCSLSELAEREVDMFTTVYIGCSQTRIINGSMVTLRGYRHETEGP